jgi:membrane-bound inhibitor of C-type lysozyme
MIGRGLFAPMAYAGSLPLGRGGGTKRTFSKLTLTCLGLIGAASPVLATEATYRCSDGTVMHAVFRGLGKTGSVQLTFPGQGRPVTLPQALSADGGRYSRGKTQFWIKGNTASFTRQGATAECRTEPFS